MPGSGAPTPVGLRRDAVARRLAAYLIEDAARYFADVPAMSLRIGVATHGGGPAGTAHASPADESALRRRSEPTPNSEEVRCPRAS